jgi:hypothetical protein
MIFQESMTLLNPVMRIGAQIEEAILAHEPKIAGQLLHRRLMAALEQAAVPEPGNSWNSARPNWSLSTQRGPTPKSCWRRCRRYRIRASCDIFRAGSA